MKIKKTAEFLEKDKSGKNAFDKLNESPSERYTSQSWDKATEIIERGKAVALQADLKMSWQDILVAQLQHPGKEIETILQDLATAEKAKADKKAKTILGAALAFATPKRLLTLAGIVGADVVNITTQNALTHGVMSILSRMFDWTFHVPVLKAISTEVSRQKDFFDHDFILTKLAVVTAGFLLLPPIFTWLAERTAAKRGELTQEGKPWKGEMAFFSYGLRMYAYFTNPVQKLFWRYLVGQKNIYSTLQNGGGIKSPGLLHTPFSSSSAAKAEDKFEEHLNTDAIRKQRAMLIACVIASEVSKENGGALDPATLMLILKANPQDNMKVFIESMVNGNAEIPWTQLSSIVYRELWKISDRGVGEIDVESVKEYYEAVIQSVGKLYKNLEIQRDTSKINQAKNWLTAKTKQFAKFTSKTVLPFIFVGSDEVYNKYKNAMIDPRNADTARHQYRADYDFSTRFYAITDPRNFSQAFGLNAESLAQLCSNQVDQIFVYGVQIGIENVEAVKVDGGLYNIAPPLILMAMNRGSVREPHNPWDVPGYGKMQNSWEAAKALAIDAVTWNKKGGILATWKVRATNTIKGWQSRFLAGIVPRAIGLFVIALAATSGAEELGADAANAKDLLARLGDAGSTALSAVPRQINTLFNKISALYGPAGFAVGYAVAWAAIQHWQNALKNAAEKNKVKLNAVDILYAQGLTLDCEDLWRSGAEDLKNLYIEGRRPIPDPFNKPTELFTLQDTIDFFEYSKAHPPLSTVANVAWQERMNQIGAFVTTAGFVALSYAMYNPNLPISPQLLVTAASFSATYLGLVLATDGLKGAVSMVRDMSKQAAKLPCKEQLLKNVERVKDRK